MKYIVIIVLFISGCSGMLDENIPDYEWNGEKFENNTQVMNWIYNNIQYKKDIDIHGAIEYWQTPEETLNLRSGDCEDYAILFLAIVNSSFGTKGNLVLIKRTDAQGHVYNHDDNYYDCVSGMEWNESKNNYMLENYYNAYVERILNYEDAMFIAYKSKRLK